MIPREVVWVFGLIAFFAGTLAAGCGMAELPSAHDARAGLNHAANAANSMRECISRLQVGATVPYQCADTIEDFDDVAEAHRLMQTFVDTYDRVTR